METNLSALQDFIFSEQYMIALGERMGKQSAHALVYEASMLAHDSGKPIVHHLLENPKVKELLNPTDLEKIQYPAQRVGAAQELTEMVIDRYRKYMGQTSAVVI